MSRPSRPPCTAYLVEALCQSGDTRHDGTEAAATMTREAWA